MRSTAEQPMAAAGGRVPACVAPHVALLRRVGYMRAAPRWHAAYRALVLALTATYLAQEGAHAWRARCDRRELARVMFLLLCHVTAAAKQLVFARDARRVEALVARCAGGGGGAAGAALERAMAWRARLVLVAYAGCAALTCVLWFVLAAVRRARGLPVDFPFWTGLSTEPLLQFAGVLLYSFVVTTLVALANTTMDAFLATVLQQGRAQLAILRMELEALPERAAASAPSGGRAHDAALAALLARCCRRHRRVIRTVALLQDVFGAAILIQFGGGGWILCMAAYQLVSLTVLSIEFASMVLFIVCILTELFLYCYCGNELTVESERVACSAYAMSWERTPPRFRRSVLLLMVHARRPLRPAAGRVVPLALDTFVKILKSSYTFYAVLRQTK